MSNKFDLMDAFLGEKNEELSVGRVVTNSNSLSDTVFIVLDTETTSAETKDKYNSKGELIIPKAKVVELAYYRMSPEGNFTHPQDRFYHPGCPIPPSSMSVHNITDKMVEGKPRIEEEIDIINHDLGDFDILAYNSNFDQQMLPFVNNRFLDVYKMAAHVYSIGELNEKGQPLTSLKQQELRFWLGLDDKYEITGEAHRADSDIQVTGFIFQEIKKHYLEVLKKPDTLDDFVEWVHSAPDYKTIPFGPMRTKFNEETGKYGVSADELDTNYLSYLLKPSNPLRSSYDSFGVTEYLQKAIMPKLEAEYRLYHDESFKSVLEDFKTLEEVKENLTEAQKVQLSKSEKHQYESRQDFIDKKTEKLKEDLNNKNVTLGEFFEKMSALNEESFSWDQAVDLNEAPVSSTKVNTPEYNIKAGVRATAKKTATRKQQGPSYLDKRKNKM